MDSCLLVCAYLDQPKSSSGAHNHVLVAQKILWNILTHSYCAFQIAGKINRTIRELGLKDLGQLEQDLVFGDAGTKDVINFLRTKPVRIFEFCTQYDLYMYDL